MYFKEYGNLEWLEPTEYYGAAWKYVCTATGDDGEEYDIVALDSEYIDGDVRYTAI